MSTEIEPVNSKEASETPVFDVTLDSWSQYSKAFKIANANTTYFFVKYAVLQATVCWFGIWLTSQSTAHVLDVFRCLTFIVAARFLFVLLIAFSFEKTRYAVKNGNLSAFGPFAEYNWQVPIEKITHIQILNAKSECPTLQLSTGYSTHIVYGLKDSKTLLDILPKSIFRTDFALLRVKLEECLDSVVHTESEPGSCQRKQLLTEKTTEALKEFPEAKLLVPAYEIAIRRMYKEMVGIAAVAAIVGVISDSTLIWLIPLLVLAARAYYLRVEKAASCLYVISADGLFELDYKRGLLNRIELDDLSLKNQKGECWWLRFPGMLEIPMNEVDKAFERLKICVRDREFKV